MMCASDLCGAYDSLCVSPSSPEAPRPRSKRHTTTSPTADSSPDPPQQDAPPRPTPKEGRRAGQEGEKDQDGAWGREKEASGEEGGGSRNMSPAPRLKLTISKDSTVTHSGSRSPSDVPQLADTKNQKAAAIIACGSIPLPKPASPTKPTPQDKPSPQVAQCPVAAPPRPPDPSHTLDLPRPPQNGRHSSRVNTTGRTSPPRYRR